MIKKNLINKINYLIEEKKYPEIKNLLPPHPEDIARIISALPTASCKLIVFRLVHYSRAVDVFEYLSTEEEEEMLKSLNSQEIKGILNEMSPDDRTELFEEVPAELVKKFMSLLSPEERKVAVQILNYPDDSIGRLITPDFVQLYEGMTAQQAIDHIRSVGLGKETIYHCYVLDNEKKLIGIVSLKKIVLADQQTKVSEIMFREVISVTAFADQEEATNIFKRYDLIVLPVVDNNNKLLGIVTFDDLVDVLEDETTEDFEKIAAVLPVEKPYLEANVFSLVWKRSFWLIVLVIFESISAFVLQRHHATIRQFIALTFFIPVLVAMGGNTGTQSATIIIRSLATGDIGVKDFFKVIFRESFVGVLIGLILAVVGAIIVAVLQKDLLLSLAVSISMGVTILLATTLGGSLPILFRKLKLDPALMSGPLIATIVDVVGILIYFEIAKLILGLN
ncbi:MAG: magnesium transporter [Candidatus Omnitrophica bacterium]|nr:magnesium transporter [Candidatus Omnitrophota bacterium]